MNIDYKLLQAQKLELVGLSMENQSHSKKEGEPLLTGDQANALDGIINLLDAIGDEFLDGMTSEREAIGSHAELKVKWIGKPEKENKFPNGFKSWIETHHVVVQTIEHILYNQKEDSWSQKLYDTQVEGGTGGIWILCETLTDKFEQENIGVEWDGEWFEAIDLFIAKELA